MINHLKKKYSYEWTYDRLNNSIWRRRKKTMRRNELVLIQALQRYKKIENTRELQSPLLEGISSRN